MKSPKRLTTLLLLLLCAALLCAGAGLADAGNFAGSSDFGGSDWGGSDWGGSSDWDSGGSDWGSSSDWDSGGSFLPVLFMSDGGGGGFGTVVAILIILFVLARLFGKGKGKGGRGGGRPAGAAPTPQAGLRPMAEYVALDPGFREADFQEKLGNLYVQLQDCWEARQLDPMRPHMTDALYNQFARQLEEYTRNGRTNHVDKIAVLGVRLMGFMQDAQNDSIVARLNTRIIDYDTDDATGELLSGSKTTELYMEYEWTLVRSKGARTEAQAELKKSFCPNCGAPVALNQSAKCEYCGSILTNAAQDWAISSIKGLSRRSAG